MVAKAAQDTGMFLSTPPSRVATFRSASEFVLLPSFYPRHPRGWRRRARFALYQYNAFLSTPPSRVATAPPGNSGISLAFLSTPPSRVATHEKRLDRWPIVFLSTPPSRVATCISLLCGGRNSCFYPRHPRGWRLPHCVVLSVPKAVSIHATLAGGDHSSGLKLV